MKNPLCFGIGQLSQRAWVWDTPVMCPTTLEQQYPGNQVFQLIPVRIIFGRIFLKGFPLLRVAFPFFLFHFSGYRFVEVACKS